MQKEDYDCVGVDVSKRTLDVALYRGEVDWKNGHIKVENKIRIVCIILSLL